MLIATMLGMFYFHQVLCKVEETDRVEKERRVAQSSERNGIVDDDEGEWGGGGNVRVYITAAESSDVDSACRYTSYIYSIHLRVDRLRLHD